jgi:hypothetical protein
MREDIWAAKWIANKILKDDPARKLVRSVNVGQIHVIEIESAIGVVHSVAVMSEAEHIQKNDLEEVIGDCDVEFVINVKGKPYIDEDAFSFSKAKCFAIGSAPELMTAIEQGNLRGYQHKQVAFLLNALETHTAVSGVERIDSKRYLIKRHFKKSVTILTIDDYHLTADAARQYIRTYPSFKVMVNVNNWARETPEGRDAARMAGSSVLTLKQLFGALNDAWA